MVPDRYVYILTWKCAELNWLMSGLLLYFCISQLSQFYDIYRDMLYKDINWNKARIELKAIQSKIVSAHSRNDKKEIHRLQQIIICSHFTHFLAVKRVTDNKGGVTPGVDGILWDTDEKKWAGVLQCRHYTQRPKEYKPQPVNRAFIPKSDGTERPLGIPCLIDRAMQFIYYCAMDPIVECVSDLDSYGFRKFRSPADAVLALRGKLSHPSASEYIYDADIQGCFDNISHDFLLTEIRSLGILSRKSDLKIIKEWLKCGVMTTNGLEETPTGTPQGGIISPMLANIALNGLESCVKAACKVKKWRWKDSSGKVRETALKVHVVRYADDFVVIAPNKGLMTDVLIPAIKNFLLKRGLKIRPDKTRLVDVYKGFEFLGFRFFKRKFDYRKVWVKKKHVGKYIIVVHPSRKKVKELNLKIRTMFRVNQNASLLINQLNPLLRGWSNYFGITHTSANFVRKMESSIIYRLLRWTRRVHPKRSVEWRVRRYFEAKTLKVRGRLVSRKWVFVAPPLVKKENTTKLVLFPLSTVKAPGWKRLTTKANPYSFEWYDYFLKRGKTQIPRSMSEKKQTLFVKQRGVCLVCGEIMTSTEKLEIHHSPPISDFPKESDWKGELQLLHQECHRELHRGLKR